MSHPHLDSAVLAALLDVMEDEYPVLLDTFLADSEDRIRMLQAGIEQGDLQAVRLTAHSFKGSCSNMGAWALVESCRLLEIAASQQDPDAAGELVARVNREYAVVRILLKGERQRYR